MARRATPSGTSRLLLFSLLFAPSVSALVTSDFGFYPEEAQLCMYHAQDKTECSPAANNKALNKCLCGNDGGFVTNTAKCLRDDEDVDEDVIDTVYAAMTDACDQSKTPLSLSRKEWNAIIDNEGEKDTTTSSTTESTASSTSASTAASTAASASTLSEASTSAIQSESSASATETSDASTNTTKDDADDDSGIPTGAIVGIAVGGAGALAIAGVLFWWFRRRRHASDESDPMLPTAASGFYNQHGGPTAYSPGGPMYNVSPSPVSGLAPAGYDHDAQNGRYSSVSGLSSPGFTPSHTPSNMGSPPMAYAGGQYPQPQQQQYGQGLYPGAHAVPPYPAAAAQGPVFEMDGSQVAGPRPNEPPVEMPGSAPAKYEPHGSPRG